MPPVKNDDGLDVVPIWINGKPQPLDPSRFIEVKSSKQNGKAVHLAQGADVATANAAADAAWNAFQKWRFTPHNERRELLLRVAHIYERRADEAVRRQVLETSCTEAWARFNVDVSARNMREMAGNITAALTGDLPPVAFADHHGLVYKEPIGPVLSIQPWNAAIVLCSRGLAAAIAAGCTVVLKSSELCPLTHHFIVEAFEEAGLPPGCLNVLSADRADGAAITEALISHRAIRKVEFVGSANVGRLVGQTAAKHLKPILMELGGKGPAIVLADANLANAAQLCAMGAFMHHGQICMSTERIIVEKSVATEFSAHLKDFIGKNKGRLTSDAVTASGAERAKRFLDDAKARGASFLIGDNSFAGDSTSSLTPTIITNVDKGAEMWDQETFGPSATLLVVENADEAVELANASAYGLNAALHTRDIYRGMQLARKLDYGQVHLNCLTTYDVESMAITGSKGSGWGSNNAAYGIQEFLVNKSVTIHDPDHIDLHFG